MFLAAKASFENWFVCGSVGRFVCFSVGDKTQNSSLETLQRAVNAVRDFFVSIQGYYGSRREIWILRGVSEPFIFLTPAP